MRWLILGEGYVEWRRSGLWFAIVFPVTGGGALLWLWGILRHQTPGLLSPYSTPCAGNGGFMNLRCESVWRVSGGGQESQALRLRVPVAGAEIWTKKLT